MSTIAIRHAHMFCGIGGGARGFNQGEARVSRLSARFECLGGIDVDPAACRDFARLAGAPATCRDLFTREQYQDFHGRPPAADWREATPADIRAAFGSSSGRAGPSLALGGAAKRPHIVFLSAPCKGFSGLLSETASRSARYQALNGLTLRGVWLVLEAYRDDPVELIIFENVPRIATRGRHLLDQILALLAAYGYAAAETAHDCGELGHLAQSRKRFLLVARHARKISNFLYEPLRRPLRGVGEVIGDLPVPLPGAAAFNPMHRMPALQWKTWVRLAFVAAGADWRSLDRLAVEAGVLRDYGITPGYGGMLGVVPWQGTSGVVAGESSPTNGRFSVADPRIAGRDGTQFHGCRIVDWRDAAGAITTQRSPGSSAQAVADPRAQGLGSDRVNYQNGGHYGVVGWAAPSGAVTGTGQHDNGRWSVADPRAELRPHPDQDEGIACGLPAADARLVAVIRALDGTWHRPFTTLELAALQGLVDPAEQLVLDGLSDQAWRERIGNCVPPPSARAIAGVMGRTLLLAWSGETSAMSCEPVWVRPVAAALMAAQPQQGAEA